MFDKKKQKDMTACESSKIRPREDCGVSTSRQDLSNEYLIVSAENRPFKVRGPKMNFKFTTYSNLFSLLASKCLCEFGK